MASAILANRNEPNWTLQRANFMGKLPFSNPNPNPKFSKKRQFQHLHQQRHLHDVDEPPAISQSAASDGASSINHQRRPTHFNSARYVTFNIANYSKKELAELKNRLVAELEQIRVLKNRIDASESQIRPGSNFTSPKKNNKKVSGNKRPFQATNFGAAVKEMKREIPESAKFMKKCGQILTKLMKQKHGHVFNTPVDVVGLQLHDYYDMIKNPMDLGTVKSKLGKNLYDSPSHFAADVRLTFNNAMKYNPKGHEVYILAEQFLSRFEELFRPIKDHSEDLDEEIEEEHVHEVQASSWDHIQKRDHHENSIQAVRAKSEQTPASVSNQNPKPQSSTQLPVRTPSPPIRAPPVKPVKQPKPKAKDPNKREMSLEEKHKLGLGLQNLPQEKMEQVVQIIRKRNGHLRQEGDEIELDIEAVDTETLWELDRFVTNYKKLVSKIKRQALMGINNNAADTAVSEGNKVVSANDRMDVATEVKKPKKGEAGDEDVDIGDEMPMSSFPPVEIEKDNGHASRSSSSSGSSSDDSSSSSDSDSGSSSGSESEDAHS
ncbi:hypothetical protein K2173_009146 [Erythroxylum novogranatense]|uniref:Uncharacterized protein n=1 Tax=Erythroxylum novogranatense TaxID=1862640 RepID=A0AAV8TD07_9ROSI|nr:hypothetical protein K2173_009146 [Erythroxylum novogranatense]